MIELIVGGIRDVFTYMKIVYLCKSEDYSPILFDNYQKFYRSLDIEPRVDSEELFLLIVRFVEKYVELQGQES